MNSGTGKMRVGRGEGQRPSVKGVDLLIAKEATDQVRINATEATKRERIRCLTVIAIGIIFFLSLTLSQDEVLSRLKQVADFCETHPKLIAMALALMSLLLFKNSFKGKLFKLLSEKFEFGS